MVGSSVYGYRFDGDCSESTRKLKGNKGVKKSSNDVNYWKVNVNNVTGRPREKLFNQKRIRISERQSNT